MHTEKGLLVINAGCDIFFNSVAFVRNGKMLTNCSKGCHPVGEIILLYCKKKKSYDDVAVELISQVSDFFRINKKEETFFISHVLYSVTL